jgi:hypothetical protein
MWLAALSRVLRARRSRGRPDTARAESLPVPMRPLTGGGTAYEEDRRHCETGYDEGAERCAESGAHIPPSLSPASLRNQDLHRCGGFAPDVNAHSATMHSTMSDVKAT